MTAIAAGGERALQERVDAFDQHELAGRPRRVDDDVYRVVAVLGSVTPVARSRLGELPHVEAAAADAIVGRSAVLERIAERAPELVVGPLAVDDQRWVAAGRPDHLPPRERALTSEKFVAPRGTARPSTTPFGIGLFTSTATLERHGMWFSYLEINRGSTLFPLPWDVYALDVDRTPAVFEVPTATAWADFVGRYGVDDGHVRYPDWAAAANEWDAVHLTLRAVATTQGVCLRADARRQPIAPPWWDVESTLWLRWCFGSVGLVHTET